jgi:predicted nucleic acid-binding protein
MNLIVTDSSVFFDIIKIQALPEFFDLDIEVCTTDFVQKEILESEQRKQIEHFIRLKKLTVFEMSAEEIDELIQFKTNRVFRTLIDKTVLWKAKQLGCPLLTGDAKLRNEATEQGVKVHGSLWVVMQLVKHEIVDKKKGIEYLEKLRIINDRLPVEEIEKLIKKLKQ